MDCSSPKAMASRNWTLMSVNCLSYASFKYWVPSFDDSFDFLAWEFLDCFNWSMARGWGGIGCLFGIVAGLFFNIDAPCMLLVVSLSDFCTDPDAVRLVGVTLPPTCEELLLAKFSFLVWGVLFWRDQLEFVVYCWVRFIDDVIMGRFWTIYADWVIEDCFKAEFVVWERITGYFWCCY